MENQIINTEPNPFRVPTNAPGINAGAVTIESSKAIAEAQGKLIIAKNFPRDEHLAYSKAIEACKRKSLAEKAIYSYPRSGSTISGPSIRLAEELARCWGNVDFGIKELSQKDGESEMSAYCWDMETNTMSSQTFVVAHVRDTKKGQVRLTEQRDIYENNANMAGRRLRARILAILPPDLVEAAVLECKKTLAGNNDTPISDRINKMVVAFNKFGVKIDTIEQRLGRKIDTMTTDDISEYIGIYNSLKDGNSSISDWFDVKLNADKSKELTELIMGAEEENK
ncbi:hypothetical protein [Ruminococcus sp.]|uniref:hypothetical protein n=1 Tax=Ruminococcus sp. TaxID=41978 RepID=UPI001B6E087E|nr:hypothetical protein [Ruminococcus sp.]MBP5431585.1 hypothetical protein [Ruminococcus sp.]